MGRNDVVFGMDAFGRMVRDCLGTTCSFRFNACTVLATPCCLLLDRNQQFYDIHFQQCCAFDSKAFMDSRGCCARIVLKKYVSISGHTAA